MSRKIKGNRRHLTFSDRILIEQELFQGRSFRSIASSIEKDPSTISKVIRLHCAVAPNATYRQPHCHYCNFFKKCNDTIMLCSNCNDFCLICSTFRKLASNCKDYNPFGCENL